MSCGREYVLRRVCELRERRVGHHVRDRAAGRDVDQFADLLKSAKTILWNGPVGVFEFDQFGEGTRTLAQAIADSDAFSIAGGGDTLAAIDKYGIGEKVSYISTGGGAFLEFVEGKVLPAVEVLGLGGVTAQALRVQR